MNKNRWTKAFILASLLALPSTAAMALTVTMVVIPCLPGQPPDQCGIKLSTESPAEWTMNNGQVLNLLPGVIYSIAGNGQVSQEPGTLNFAALSTGTTGSFGGGGGGGAGPTTRFASGGTNSGGTTPGNTPQNTTTFTFNTAR
jgi:uncharacterized membrane protein YgcG